MSQLSIAGRIHLGIGAVSRLLAISIEETINIEGDAEALFAGDIAVLRHRWIDNS